MRGGMIVVSACLPMRGVYRGSAVAAVTLAALALASPARADRCDDLAAQLKAQIDGVAIGKTAANVIYLSHPAAKALRLGCPNRTVKNEVFGIAPQRKPSAEFQDLIASAAAIVSAPAASSIFASASGLPCSCVISGAMVSMRARIRSAALRITL